MDGMLSQEEINALLAGMDTSGAGTPEPEDAAPARVIPNADEELNDAENTLMLNVGAYFVAGDEETAVMAANIYRSIVAAHGSGSGISKVYKWSDAKKVGHICD